MVHFQYLFCNERVKWINFHFLVEFVKIIYRENTVAFLGVVLLNLQHNPPLAIGHQWLASRELASHLFCLQTILPIIFFP